MNTQHVKLENVIRHTERIAGCWEVSTLTEDGHRISGFGVTCKQAIYNAHQKAKIYGNYNYPTFYNGNGVTK